jgi:hypothetical protein
MNKPYATTLNTEWSSVEFSHEFLTVLESRDLQVKVEQLYSVGTIRHGSTESSSYLMAVVSHLPDSLDNVDVVDTERVETLICGCPGFYNHCYDNDVGAKIDDCKHTERVKELRRTELPENQETLV